MDCDLCGTQNRASARFCGGCGSALARRCPSCKAELDAGLSFCDQCGTTLEPLATSTPRPTAATPAPAGAVRKTVTVLFADLGGSTGFGERTDPEISRQVLAQYHALLQETIDAHLGTVAKFMGDGMMATFGIPEVAEDDARRAVLAGLDIQTRFEYFAHDVLARYGETLTLRVGINTGEVVIAAGDADMVGDALNVAARLEKACRPGHVLVGDETWRITRGDLAYEPLGAVTVAGREQPVGTYEVAASEVTAAEPVAPFVGRDEELHRLLRALARAQAERTAVLVTVLGSPGVGKTRLSRELGIQAEAAEGARTFEIRCDRAGTATFAPIADLLRAAADLDDENESDLDGTRTRERVTLLVGADDPDAIRVVDVLAGVLGAAPARSVEETFWAIRRLFESLAGEHPLVVVIDDIQWAEPKLLDLLEHLAEWVTNAPVLLVGLARPELRELRASLTEPGRRVADVLALDGLDRAATEALAAGLLGSALPRELVERLPASTDGNPLFVRELVRMLVDDQVIQRREDGTWMLAIDAEAVDVPPTIQSLLGARVERLPANERRVLELASVIGAEFSVGALDHLIEGDLRVGVLLEAMRRKELVEPTGTYWGDDPVHRFHHVLIRDAAYRRLLKTSRAELHRQVGEWTDASAATLIGEHEAAIAFHYEQAHRYRTELGSRDEETDAIGQRAADLLAVASNRALDRDDLAAAGALARRALAVLPDSEAEARAELLLVACECSLASGDVSGATPLVDELRAIAGPNEQLAAWGECFRAQLVGLTDPQGLIDADALATAAAATLARLGDGAGEAKAHQVRAGLLARLGRVGEAEAVLDLALGAARAVDDRRRVTAVLGAAPVAALFGPSPVARAGGRCLDVVRLLRITTASPSVEATSMRCQAVLEALRGRFDVSRSMLASAREALEELGITHGLLETDLFAGMVEVIAGDSAAAVVPLRSAYEGLGALGVGADAGQAGALLAQALLEEGHIDEADLAARESEAVAGQNLKTAIAWRVARARVHAARGDADAGVALAEEAVGIAAATDLVLDHADACVALADLRDAAGDAGGAGAARADALRLYEAKGATVPAARLSDAASTSEDPVRASMRASEPEAPSRAGDTRTALAVNAASRFLEQLRVALNAGDYEAAGRLTADGYVFEDRRSIVAVPDVEALTSDTQAATAQGFVILEPEVIAVRGERLCLRRLVYRTPEGDESPRLVVDELGPDGRLARSVFFDEDDLTVALAELDRSYYFGEGAPFQRVIRAVGRYAAAMDGGDVGEFRERMAPDFVVVDHKPLGFGAGDRAYFLEMTSVSQTDGWGINRVVYVNEHALLTVNSQTPMSAEGSQYERSGCVVMGIDDSDRVNRLELYGDDDFAAALTRFDELDAGVTADPRTPFADNLASRFMEQLRVAFNSKDRAALGRLIAPGSVHDDRRSIVATVDLDPIARMADLEATIDQGFSFAEPVIIAVRGERLALSRMVTHTAAGDESARLSVNELDAEGRMVRSVLFDDDDLPAALRALDAAYFVGEGEPFQRLLTVCGKFGSVSLRDDTAELACLVAPGFVFVDRRLLGYGDGDLQYLLDAGYTGLDRVEGSVVDRVLHLAGSALLTVQRWLAISDTGSEFEQVTCYVMHVDESGLVDRLELYDEADFSTALARLDELGADGRSGPAIENLASRAAYEFAACVSRGDIEGLRARISDRFERDDYRRVTGQGNVRGKEAMLENLGALVDLGIAVSVLEILATRGDGLALTSLRFEADGFRTEILELVSVDATGAHLYLSDFDIDDRARAVRQLDELFSAVNEDLGHGFDELGGESSAPPGTVENATTKLIARTLDLMNRGDWDTLAAMNVAADGIVRFDRRRTVSAPTLNDRESFGANAAGIYEVFGVVHPEPVAVRGDRLALIRLHCGEAPAFTMQMLVVYELDEDGRIAREVDYDDDDLDAALDELDERFTAGEGAEHEYTVRRLGDFRTAQRARDWDAFAALVAEDFALVDHRSMGLPDRDRAGYVGVMRASDEQTPGGRLIQRSLAVRGDVVLARTGRVGSTPDGLEYEWEQIAVMVWGAGLLRRVELFAVADEPAARVRFAELAAQTLTPYVDNKLVRISVRGQWLGRFTDERPGFYRDDCVLDDRRPGVNAGTVHGADSVRSNIQSGVDVFGVLDIDWLAVRGDRLGLNRWAFVAEGGFEAPGVSVIELDENDLVCQVTSFDESDLADALEMLDERWIAGEGAEHDDVIRWWREFGSAYRDRDWAAVEEGFAPDAVLVDHRSIGQGWTDRADFLTSTRAVVELVPDVQHLPRRLEIRGRVTLTDGEAFGTTTDGSRYSWGYHMVTQWAGGRVTRLEIFDAEESAAARVRFDELAGETAEPDPDNAAARLIADASRLLWTDLEAALDRFSPDAIGVARESGPSLGLSAENREMWRDVLGSLADTYDDVRYGTVAVRGDRLALLRQEFVTDGYVTPALLLVETDQHDQILRLETFAEEDLSRALDEIELRYARSGELTRAARQVLLLAAGLNHRRWSELDAVLAPNVVITDHRRLGFPPATGKQHLVGALQALVGQVPDVVAIVRAIDVSGPAVWAVVDQVGSSTDGVKADWSWLFVVAIGDDGKLAQVEYFDTDDADRAHARFEEFSRR